MNKRIIFLDYDGVVNTPMWNADGTSCTFNFPESGKVNNYQAVQWISEFCEKFEFAIVVTSDWRQYPNWKECLIKGGLRSGVEILGATPIGGKSRGWEIEQWLDENPGVEYYYIIDDIDQVKTSQKSRFLQTDPSVGFCMTDYIELRGKYLTEKAENNGLPINK